MCTMSNHENKNVLVIKKKRVTILVLGYCDVTYILARGIGRGLSSQKYVKTRRMFAPTESQLPLASVSLNIFRGIV